jgi:hypothetical protein
MAMAPPLTLTFAVSQPSSLLTAQACAAKASLASIRSRSADLPAGLLQRAALAGMGPMPMIDGSTPAVAHDTMRASGVSAALLGFVGLISTSAAAPSLMPEALPAVTVPSLDEGRAQLGQRLDGRAVRGIRRCRPRCRPCGP